MIMLLGAMKKTGRGIRSKPVLTAIAVMSFGYYTFQSVTGLAGAITIIKPIAGMLFSYSIGSLLLELNDCLPICKMVSFASQVTLETYLVHYISIKAFMKNGFPTNILYAYISAFGTAYCLRLLAEKVAKTVTSGISRRRTIQ